MKCNKRQRKVKKCRLIHSVSISNDWDDQPSKLGFGSLIVLFAPRFRTDHDYLLNRLYLNSDSTIFKVDIGFPQMLWMDSIFKWRIRCDMKYHRCFISVIWLALRLTAFYYSHTFTCTEGAVPRPDPVCRWTHRQIRNGTTSLRHWKRSWIINTLIWNLFLRVHSLSCRLVNVNHPRSSLIGQYVPSWFNHRSETCREVLGYWYVWWMFANEI